MGIFDGLKFYFVSGAPEDARRWVTEGGGQIVDFVLSDPSHVIAERSDSPEIAEAFDCLPPSTFCVVKISKEDAEILWCVLHICGGSCVEKLDKDSGLICGKATGKRYEIAVQESLVVVTPDWVTDSIRVQSLVPVAEYHPRLLHTEKVQQPQTVESDLNLTDESVIASLLGPDFSDFGHNDLHSTNAPFESPAAAMDSLLSASLDAVLIQHQSLHNTGKRNCTQMELAGSRPVSESDPYDNNVVTGNGQKLGSNPGTALVRPQTKTALARLLNTRLGGAQQEGQVAMVPNMPLAPGASHPQMAMQSGSQNVAVMQTQQQSTPDSSYSQHMHQAPNQMEVSFSQANHNVQARARFIQPGQQQGQFQMGVYSHTQQPTQHMQNQPGQPDLNAYTNIPGSVGNQPMMVNSQTIHQMNSQQQQQQQQQQQNSMLQQGNQVYQMQPNQQQLQYMQQQQQQQHQLQHPNQQQFVNFANQNQNQQQQQYRAQVPLNHQGQQMYAQQHMPIRQPPPYQQVVQRPMQVMQQQQQQQPQRFDQSGQQQQYAQQQMHPQMHPVGHTLIDNHSGNIVNNMPSQPRMPQQQQQQQQLLAPMGMRPSMELAGQMPPPRPGLQTQQSVDGKPAGMMVRNATPKELLYVGMDCLNLPPAKFLMSSKFTMVDIKDLTGMDARTWKNLEVTIKKHGGSIVPAESMAVAATHFICETQAQAQTAIKLGKRVVTLYWLNDCYRKGQMLPPWRYAHIPSPFHTDQRPLRGKVATVTGFHDDEREDVIALLLTLGAKYQPFLNRDCSVMVSKSSSGKKFVKALEWKIPSVNAVWLHDVWNGVVSAIDLAGKDQKYLIFNYDAPLDVGSKALPAVFLAAWINPVAIPADQQSKLASTKGRPINAQNPKKKIKKQMVDNECKKKRKLGPVVILFDGIDKSEENKLTKNMKGPSLGVSITEKYHACTHLVTNRISRTPRFLITFCACKYVVSSKWIEDSIAAEKVGDTDLYVPQDLEAESRDTFSLRESLARKVVLDSAGLRVLSGYHFYVTPRVYPQIDTFSEIIEAAGGKTSRHLLPTLDELSANGKNGLYIVIIGTVLDHRELDFVIKTSHPVFSAEFVLSAIIKQKVDWGANRLDFSSMLESPSIDIDGLAH